MLNVKLDLKLFNTLNAIVLIFIFMTVKTCHVSDNLLNIHQIEVM